MNKEYKTKKNINLKNKTKKLKYNIVKLPNYNIESIIVSTLKNNYNENNISKLNNITIKVDNYIKFNKYQLVDNNYSSKNKTNNILKFKTYKNKLTNLKIEEIETKLIQTSNYIKINLLTLKNNIDDIINYLQSKKVSEYELKVLNHDLTSIFLIIHTTRKTKISDTKNIKTILINNINKIILQVEKVFAQYDDFSKKYIKTSDFYEIMEHLIFNNSFDYLKSNNLCDKIVKSYKNIFGDKKEIMFTNNMYIKDYYPYTSKQKDLQISNVGLYSISKPFATSKIINIMKTNLNIGKLPLTKELIITDATAGVGGDTIAFAKEYKKVNSVEIIKTHSNIIKHNSSLYNFKNINHINADYTKIFKDLKQDIVFIDSPWGGTAYKDNLITDLYLFGSKIKFIDFINILLNVTVTKVIFLKTPANFDVRSLKKVLSNNKIITDNVNNFLLITIFK